MFGLLEYTLSTSIPCLTSPLSVVPPFHPTQFQNRYGTWQSDIVCQELSVPATQPSLDTSRVNMRKHPSCHACDFHVQWNVTKLPTCPWWSQTQWPASMPTPNCPQNSPKKTPTTIPRLSQLTSAPHIIHKFGQTFDTSKIPGCVMEHHMFLKFLYRFDKHRFKLAKWLVNSHPQRLTACVQLNSIHLHKFPTTRAWANPTGFQSYVIWICFLFPVGWAPAAATHHSLRLLGKSCFHKHWKTWL